MMLGSVKNVIKHGALMNLKINRRKNDHMKTQILSKQTQRNWWIVATLFSSAVVAALSGIYFLFLPIGGYQGGRNPYYNVRILFQRETWDDLHTWGGIVMIGVVLIHLVVHWSWVVSMSQKIWNELTEKNRSMSKNGRLNLIINLIVAVCFLFTAISGVYFFFTPGGQKTIDPMFLFSRTTWDLLHTWAGVILMIAALVHIAIHWKWITKVSGKMVTLALPSKQIAKPNSITN
jgi:cytochrome b subunit of formate dehydrogenase